MTFRRCLPLLLSAILFYPAARAAISSTVDRDHLALGDTLTLSMAPDHALSGNPDLSTLQRDFDVLGSSGENQASLTNGHLVVQSRLLLTLRPRHGGQLVIPALRWDNDHTTALTITVDATAASGQATPAAPPGAPREAPATGSDSLFVTSTLSPGPIYARTTHLLTVRVYVALDVSQITLDQPPGADLTVQATGKDQQYEETRGNRRYRVVERQYFVSPQRSGTLTLPGARVEAVVLERGGSSGMPSLDELFATPQAVQLSGKPVSIEVRPVPGDPSTVAAQQLTLEETWTPPTTNTVHVGDPLTRHLQLHAAGLSGNQLPDIGRLQTLPEGLKAYPDQARTSTAAGNNQVTSSSDQDVAIIASQPGHYRIPALHYVWVDSATGQQRDAELPAHELDVLPIAIGSDVAAPPATSGNPSALAVTSSEHSNHWQLLTALFAGLWIATMTGWWWDRRRQGHSRQASPDTASDKPAAAATMLKAFRAACEADQAREARLLLLDWADRQWPEFAPHGLSTVGRRVGSDARTMALLAELDAACFGGQGDWKGSDLAAAIRAPAEPSRRPQTSMLPPLYPEAPPDRP